MRIIHDQTTRDMLGAATVDFDNLRSLRDGVLLLDDQGLVIDLNDIALASLKKDLRGAPFWQPWPRDVQPALEMAVNRGLSGHITQFWCRFEHDDGSVSQWDVRVSPLHDALSRVRTVLAVARRLTAQ